MKFNSIWITWFTTVIVERMINFVKRWLPVFVWAGLIFFFSSRSNPADYVPWFIVRFLWKTHIFGQRLFMVMGVVGHLFNYGVLAYLIARAVMWKAAITPKYLVFAFLVSFIYGISDEVHQYFVPMRTFQVSDLVVNGIGAIVGLKIFSFYRAYLNRRKLHNSLLL